MTLEILNYIHELIELDVESKRQSYEDYKTLVERQETEEGVSWETKDSKVSSRLRDLRRAKNVRRQEMFLAEEALSQIESKDWKGSVK